MSVPSGPGDDDRGRDGLDAATRYATSQRDAPGSPGILVGALVALSVIALPMCDAASEAELARAVAGAGLGSTSGGASAVGAYVLWLAIGAGIVFIIAKAFAVHGRALPLVIIGALIGGGMVSCSTAKIALRRSHAIDSWSVCERPGNSPQGHPVYVSTYNHKPRFDGPHLDNGEPCVASSELRDVHAREHPDGDVADGIHQIMYRFARDRERVIYGPAALLLGLVLALVLTIVSERRRARSFA